MQANLERIRERREQDGDRGFTLIELLIVIVILGILAAIVVFAVQNLGKSSSQASCSSDQKTVEIAAETYKAQIGVYPGGTVPSSIHVTPATSADGLVGKVAGEATDIDKLLGTATSNSNTLGPWLKDVPVNTNHYAVGLKGSAGTIVIFNGSGTSASVATCNAVTQ